MAVQESGLGACVSTAEVMARVVAATLGAVVERARARIGAGDLTRREAQLRAAECMFLVAALEGYTVQTSSNGEHSQQILHR